MRSAAWATDLLVVCGFAFDSSTSFFDESKSQSPYSRSPISAQTLGSLDAAWERYVEERLVVALNHAAKHLLKANAITGMTRVRRGLAIYFVRGGKDYFDFRNMEALHQKADAIVGKTGNPLRAIAPADEKSTRCGRIITTAAIG